MTPANKPPLRDGSGRQDQSVHVPARGAAERRGALRQPADRGRDRRDAGGRDGRRGAAGAALRDAARPRRSRCRRKLRAAGRRRRQSGGGAARRCRGRPCRGGEADRRDLRDAAAISQRDGAARDRGGMGRRHAVDRHAEPGPRAWRRARIAGLFGIAPDKIHIRSPFLGGGFGSKGFIAGPQVLGIMAARLVGRPVKLVLRREQMYGPVGHRAPTRQTLRIGTDGDGRADRARSSRARPCRARFDDFYEPAADASHTLYASPAIRTSHEAVRVNTGTPLFMRAPGEATGSIALESAIDEAAWACGIDPLAFRLKNYAEVEPISGKPFSSKALRECYAQGAERFGWSKRPLAAAADARRGRPAGRLGHGHGDLPGADVPGRSARGDPPRRHRRDGDRRARHGAGRLDGARPDRGRRARARYRPSRVQVRAPPTCRTPASPAARRTPPPRARRSTTPARPSSPSSPISPPATSARRCSAPAMPA